MYRAFEKISQLPLNLLDSQAAMGNLPAGCFLGWFWWKLPLARKISWCYKNQNPTMCHHVTIFHTSNFSKEDKVHHNYHNFWGALQTLSRVQVLPRYADTCEPIEGQVTAIPTPNGKGSSHRITSFPSELITRSNGSTPKLIPCTGYAISMKLQESYVKHEQHINLSYISVA